MENKAHAMAAGIFVVLMAVLLIGLASWLTRDTGSRDPYEISTREAVTGLQAQAPVRYRGVDVGKVASIGFDPKAEGNVLLHLEIDREAPVTRDTFAMLNLQGITGLAFIQLDDHGNPAPRLAPEDGHPPRIPLKRSLLSKLESQGEEILGKVDEATARINKLLSDENQRRFSGALANLDTAAASASELTKHLDATVTQRLDPALVAAPATMQALSKSADEVRKTAADFDVTARRLNERDGPIDRLAQGTDALSHAADSFNTATLPRLNRVADETSRAVRQLGRAANGIGDNPQSLIFGTGKVPPGPGEPGFQPPGASR
jgi:phospholipid/cholesterol/gamma-HCH transport system substrate-binding protein